VKTGSALLIRVAIDEGNL